MMEVVAEKRVGRHEIIVVRSWTNWTVGPWWTKGIAGTTVAFDLGPFTIKLRRDRK